MSKNTVFTSESVSEGHPDKLCDAVSDAILDACLAQDPKSRVACETLAKTGMVVVAGEITTKAIVNYAEVARKAVTEIGYDHQESGFNGNICAVLGDCFNGYAFSILGNLNVAIGFGLDLHLGQRNLIAFGNGRTASQSAVNSGLIGYQLRTGGLADRAHNAHDGAQRVPVLAKAGDKVNLAGVDSNLGGGSQVSFCSHILAPFC